MINTSRIEGRIRELGLTQESLAEKMDVSRRTVSTILSTGRLNKEKYLPLMADILEVTQDWITGDSLARVEEDRVAYNAIRVGNGDKLNMWWVPAKAQGGFVRGFAHRMFSHQIQRLSMPVISGECFCFEVEGFSMYPDLVPGSYIVCTLLEDITWLQKGKPYVFQTDDGLFVKLYRGIEDGVLQFEAANPTYNPVKPMREDEIKQVYAIEFELNKYSYKK